MDIYDFKMMGHSGFDNCKIVDSDYYSTANGEESDYVLFLGDIDDAPECLDGLEITSIDVWWNAKANRLEATIDVEGVDDEVHEELEEYRSEESDDGLPSDGSEPQLATDPNEAGQWYE